jgi:Phage integrase family
MYIFYCYTLFIIYLYLSIKFIRFHDLRHTFATRLVQNGVDFYRVQKLGRWKNVTMVQRYAHHYPESLRAAIEMIDGVKKPIITILSQSQKNRVSMSPLRFAERSNLLLHSGLIEKSLSLSGWKLETMVNIYKDI